MKAKSSHREALVEDVSHRAALLEDARRITVNDRNRTYGPPDADFERIARLWTVMGLQFDGKPLESHHVAMAMIQLKISRLNWGPDHRDSWLDIAGYAACGHEAYVIARERDGGP